MACVLMGALCAACSSRAGDSSKGEAVWTTDSIRSGAPQAMQSSLAHEDVTFRGKNYHTTVSRQADRSLPIVTNEQGEKFVDNRIKLRVECNNRTIVDREFTKNDFAAWVDARFLRYAILEALVFNEVTSSGLAFSASICYPQTDLYLPLRITVEANGNLRIEREELEEAPASVEDSIRNP